MCFDKRDLSIMTVARAAIKVPSSKCAGFQTKDAFELES